MVDTRASYTYYITDLITNTVIGELPVTGVGYDRALKDAGSFSGTVSIDADSSVLNLYNMTMPGKRGLYVMRNGKCVWGGIIWSRSYDLVGKSLSISASEFTSYLHHRKIWKTWDLTHGVLVSVYDKDSRYLKVELTTEGDKVTLPPDTAIELAFIDAKGVPYNGHYRVVSDFTNASWLLVDKNALQWNSANGKAPKTSFPTKDTKINITQRKVADGSGEIEITTEKGHFLSVGDEVVVDDLDSDLPDTVTVYESLSKTYPIAALTSTSELERNGTVVAGTKYITMPSGGTFAIEVGAVISQKAYPANDNRSSNEGVLPSSGPTLKMVVTSIVGNNVYWNNPDYPNDKATRSGNVRVVFKNQESGYNRIGETVYFQPKDKSWMGVLGVGTNDYISFSGITAPGGGDDRFFKNGLLAKDEPQSDLPRYKYAGLGPVATITDMATYTKARMDSDYPSVPIIRADYINGTFTASSSGWDKPTMDASFTIVKSKAVITPNTKSEAAKCVNGKKTPIIKIINTKKFVVAADCNASQSSTKNQEATVTFKPFYQAMMYTHTDTYDQVRYLLRHVFNDFVSLNVPTPTIGNLDTLLLRTASYDPATDLATITTGFIQPAHSKSIEVDTDGKLIARVTLADPYVPFRTDGDNTDVEQTIKVTGDDESINGEFEIKDISTAKDSIKYDLPREEQKDVESYGVTGATATGGSITYTSTAHKIKIGQYVTVQGIVPTTLNCVHSIVTEVTTNTFTVTATGSGTYISPGTAYTSWRCIPKTYLAPTSTILTFGWHGLTPNTNIKLSGLSRQNYDGTWLVNSVIDDVTFTYKPTFEKLIVTHTEIFKRGASDYMVRLRLNRIPNTDKYVYKNGYTRLTVAGMGAPYDGTWTLDTYEENEESEIYNFVYKLDSPATPHKMRIASYSERKSETTYAISLADYVRDTVTVKGKTSATGTGNVTYTTSTNHGILAGEYVVVSNVGGYFTEKTDVSTGNHELILKTSAVTSNTVTIPQTSTQDALYYAAIDAKISQSNTSVASPTSATIVAYDASATRPDDRYPTVNIDDLPTIDGFSKLTANVLGKAFNSEKGYRVAFLQLDSDPGFEIGQVVDIADVDEDVDSIFDGEYAITYVTKDAFGKTQIRFKTRNITYKKDIGTWDGDTGKKKGLKNYTKDTSGTVTASSKIYVGTYGSFVNNADIGIEFSTEAYSGFYMRADTYRGHELITVGEALSRYADKYITRPTSTKLIKNVYGFDYRIDCEFDYNTSSFRRIFTFVPINFPNEPAHGQVSPPSRFGADKVVFEYPGNIDSVTLEESSEESANRFWMVGSDGGTGTENAAKSYVGLSLDSYLMGGWPILDADQTNDKLTRFTELTEHASRYLNESQPPSGNFSISVNGSLDPQVGSFEPGQWCTIIINDEYVQQRLDSGVEPRRDVIVRKINNYSVSVPDSPSFPESMSLELSTEWDVDKRGIEDNGGV